MRHRPERRSTSVAAEVILDPAVALRVPADAVVIATPPTTHGALAAAALAERRHVYVEKPMATTAVEADALVADAVAARRTVQVGYAYRFHPLWQRIVALVGTGRLRTPFAANAVFDARPGSGWNHPMLDVGLHHIDLLSLVAGTGPGEVHALGERRLAARWADGSTLDGTYGPGPGRDEMDIRFVDRCVHIDRRNGVRLRGAGIRGAVPDPTLLRARPQTTGWERSFERALRSFVDRSIAGEAAVPGPEEGRRAVGVGLAIRQSLEHDQAVPVPT